MFKNWMLMLVLVLGCTVADRASSAEGVVKYFNYQKGFGSIILASENKEIIVHMIGLIDQIKDNDAVSFDIEKLQRSSVMAINVRLKK